MGLFSTDLSLPVSRVGEQPGNIPGMSEPRNRIAGRDDELATGTRESINSVQRSEHESAALHARPSTLPVHLHMNDPSAPVTTQLTRHKAQKKAPTKNLGWLNQMQSTFFVRLSPRGTTALARARLVGNSGVLRGLFFVFVFASPCLTRNGNTKQFGRGASPSHKF